MHESHNLGCPKPSNTHVVQQFDTISFEVVFEHQSVHIGVLLAGTAVDHSVDATTCGSHAGLVSIGMETSKLRIVYCFYTC